jgi:hypothetical protein
LISHAGNASNMKNNLTAIAIAAGTLLLPGNPVSGETIAVSDNPYQSIIQRNLFGLQPPPPPAAPEIQIPPLTITLTGITTVLGDQRVLFKTPSPDAVGWKQHMLAVGQSEDEIKLVSVDVPSATARFNNHGVLQEVAICKAPSSANVTPASAITAPETDAARMRPAGNFARPQPVMESPDDSPFVRGMAGRNGTGARAAANSGTPANNDNNSVANEPSGANSSPGASADAQFALANGDPWWLAGSKLTEQARINSAADVRAGLADPQPLTPLTPPGTPAGLIGSDRAFFTHW